MSLKEAFLGHANKKPTLIGKVSVPAVSPEEVQICKVSAAGRDRITAAMLGIKDGKALYRAQVIIETACDASGRKLFTQDDAVKLATLDADLLEPIFDESNRLNKYEDQADLEKNSSNAQTSGSATA